MTSPESSIRFRNVQPGQIEEVRRPERPPVRRFDRTPPPKVTLTGVIQQVIEAETGNPIIIVRIGDPADGAEIECSFAVERFYGEDAKHVGIGVPVEITGGDGTGWFVTRTLAVPNADHIDTIIESGQGRTTISDTHVTIHHRDGVQAGRVTTQADSTIIDHADLNSQQVYSFQLDPGGMAALGPLAAFYTRSSDRAATAAPDGALVFGHRGELGAAAGTLVAHPIPMLHNDLDLDDRIMVHTDQSTGEMYINLRDFITDTSNLVRISGAAGSAGSATPGTVSAPTNLRYIVVHQGNTTLTNWTWTRPAQFSGLAQEYYDIEVLIGPVVTNNGLFDMNAATATTLASGVQDGNPTTPIVRHYVPNDAMADRIFIHTLDGVGTGIDFGIFGRGQRSATIASAAVTPPLIDGGDVPTQGIWRPPAGIRVIAGSWRSAIIVIAQPGDMINTSGVITWTSTTASINYAMVLGLFNGRLENVRGIGTRGQIRTVLTPAEILSVRAVAYRVRAEQRGAGIISAPSQPAVMFIIELDNWEIAPIR